MAESTTCATLMIATKGQVLHSADKNTLICQQVLGSHRNNTEEVNATACTFETNMSLISPLLQV